MCGGLGPRLAGCFNPARMRRDIRAWPSSAIASGASCSTPRPPCVGRTFLLDGEPLTVVGVMPASIEIGNLALVDIWTPLPLDATASRDRRTLRVVGRLAPAATVTSADAELQPLVGCAAT